MRAEELIKPPRSPNYDWCLYHLETGLTTACLQITLLGLIYQAIEIGHWVPICGEKKDFCLSIEYLLHPSKEKPQHSLFIYIHNITLPETISKLYICEQVFFSPTTAAGKEQTADQLQTPTSPNSTWRIQADKSFLCWALLICHFDSQHPQIYFSVQRPIQSHSLSRRQEMLEYKSKANGGWGSGFPLLWLNGTEGVPDEKLSHGCVQLNLSWFRKQ